MEKDKVDSAGKSDPEGKQPPAPAPEPDGGTKPKAGEGAEIPVQQVPMDGICGGY